MKIKIILRHGTALAVSDEEAAGIPVEIVGCDDCSPLTWAAELDEPGLTEHKSLTVRVAKDKKEKI